LHFGQRDIALSQSSVSVEYRVMRILPALIGESLFARSFIFHKSIAVRIAWTIYPIQGRFDGWPQRGDGRVIASAFRIKTSQQNKQRRRIDTSVVQTEGHFAQCRHFAAAHLVQDLQAGRLSWPDTRPGAATRHVPRPVSTKASGALC
jgi:hypothetical protein